LTGGRPKKNGKQCDDARDIIDGGGRRFSTPPTKFLPGASTVARSGGMVC
jgi:hypothetical protein